MNIGQQRAVHALDTAFEGIENFGTSGDYAALLFGFTTTLFEVPAVAMTCEALVRERSTAVASTAEFLPLLFEAIKSDVRNLSKTASSALEEAAGASAEVRKAAEDSLQTMQRRTLPVESRSISMANFLGRTSEHDFKPSSEQGLSELRSLVVLVAQAFDNVTLSTGWHGDRWELVVAACRRIDEALRVGLEDYAFVRGMVDAVALEPIVNRLKQFHIQARRLLYEPCRGPLPADLKRALSMEQGEAITLSLYAKRIHSLLRVRLNSRVEQQYVLARMRAYFQHFAKRDLISELSRIKAKPKRQHEEVIQRYVDRFIFDQGLFPITHADATSGKIDTFVERNEPLFAEAAATHQLPLLIELKQAIELPASVSATRKALLKIADQAQRQAAIYSEHIRSRAAWSDLDVAAVVFYAGKTRFASSQNGLTLVYVGDAPPSAGSESL